ncbi:MAG: lytic transglycosylase domain-containing protein [Desulfobacteraceae bacterium]|nr:MAG: lytic transglycosylase domain-containing protein [Desulfobacteraceae bacterium]
MERASHINSSFEDLAYWLISATIFLLLVAPYLYKGQKHTQQPVEKVLVSEHRRVSDNHQNTEIAHLLIHTTSDQRKMSDEIMEVFEQTIVSSIDFAESFAQARTDTALDQGISLDEKMAVFESVIASATNVAKPIPAVQTDPKGDHAITFSNKITPTKKVTISRTELRASTAPEHSKSDLDFARLPDGSLRVNVSQPLQGKQSESAHGKIISLPHEEKAEHRFNHIIQRAANRYEVDPALVRAIIMAESSYNPKAVSKKGAKGLMQLMPRTAEYLGVEDSFNPEHNIDAGVRYFKQLLDQFKGDVKLALAAYNAGSRRVRKYKGIPPFKDTQYYVRKVFEYHKRFKK